MSSADLLRVCALALALGACSADSPVAVETSPEVPQPTPPTAPASVEPTSLTLTSTYASIAPTETTILRLVARDAAGAEVYAGVGWTTSDPTIASLQSSVTGFTRLTGIAAGTTTITAWVAGQSRSITITVRPPPTGEGTLIVVESFRVIEFQYPSLPGHYSYAPEVRLRETANGTGATVTGTDFTIPGFGPVPPCGNFRRIEPGGVLDLFVETYGDFGLTIDQRGERASGTEASITLTVTDGFGVGRKLTATGPIVPGALPTTYTGGAGFRPV